ncbi:ureidoglycolate lyase [Paenibacillus piri]|nr:ureidoglycolate lyase [Paenibacillus piri]
MTIEMRNVTAKPLSGKGFEKYGDVISTEGQFSVINQGTGLKWNDLVGFDMHEGGGIVNLGILRTKSIAPVFSQMERHLFTSQIFIPLGGKRSLVAVAPANDEGPDPDEVEVFVMEGNQGISFFRKTWHHTLFPLDGETEYILMMRGGNIQRDVELVPIKNNIQFTVI